MEQRRFQIRGVKYNVYGGKYMDLKTLPVGGGINITQ
jgi:hypothetical protein